METVQIKIEFDDKKLQRGFVNIQKANQIATAKTLNQIAFMSRKNAIKNLNDNFILRNNFTTRQIQVEKANEIDNINNMQSSFGATDKADYLKLHEDGGIKKPKRGNNLAIAQIDSRLGNKRRLVSRNLYLKKIQNQMIRGSVSKNFRSKKALTVARAYKAFQTNKFLRYKNNIYSISSFKKSGSNIHFNKKHIYNLSQKNARIKQNQWMLPAIEKPIRDAQNIYNSQINKLLKQKEII